MRAGKSVSKNNGARARNTRGKKHGKGKEQSGENENTYAKPGKFDHLMEDNSEQTSLQKLHAKIQNDVYQKEDENSVVSKKGEYTSNGSGAKADPYRVGVNRDSGYKILDHIGTPADGRTVYFTNGKVSLKATYNSENGAWKTCWGSARESELNWKRGGYYKTTQKTSSNESGESKGTNTASGNPDASFSAVIMPASLMGTVAEITQVNETGWKGADGRWHSNKEIVPNSSGKLSPQQNMKLHMSKNPALARVTAFKFMNGVMYIGAQIDASYNIYLAITDPNLSDADAFAKAAKSGTDLFINYVMLEGGLAGFIIGGVYYAIDYTIGVENIYRILYPAIEATNEAIDEATEGLMYYIERSMNDFMNGHSGGGNP